MNQTPTPDTSPDFVQSLARGLAVIAAFSAERPRMTLTEVAAVTDLTRATARRFLVTLEHLGYVRSDTRQFSLTPRVLELGYSYLSALRLPDVIAPRLQELSAQLHESASAAVLDGGDITYIARSAGRKIMQVQITVGTRFPAYATAMGRVLLAALPRTDAASLIEASSPRALTPHTKTSLTDLQACLHEVRHAGYSLVDEEHELGLRSLAMPIHDSRGNVLAAINVSTVARAPIADTLVALLPGLRATALLVNADLAATGTSLV
ncbi:IclR family transcriptional regulator domain-containing protein [Cryobacterium ruanii]|uniref:Glycerol operon regulatory protein n=1 Tax=Cryobacterium ruanii TaxID=1259197 RepID=A0A4R9AN42_9MICO|nr:IclR family transcriptional regulator C-terminal domain-containing protein [Cryobacterium ruanii]TFD65135.1 IclR family transcriptional regulator [Cryobacterium ruanii]